MVMRRRLNWYLRLMLLVGFNVDHSGATQRAIILGYLQRGLHLTTRYARTHLDIMNPSARVGELRKLGHDIVAHRRTIDGHSNVAEYVLLSNTKPH
jgi:hypothetical protein